MSQDLIDQFSEHEKLSSVRFLDQFKNSVDLKALAASYAGQIQDLEDAVFEVILERVLPTAEGVQLTILGAIVQQPRTTNDDTEFKIAINARIAINLSDSTPEDVIKVGVLIFETTGETFCIREEPPAQLRVTVIDPLTISPTLVQQLLDEADAAGNRLLLSYTPSAIATRLRFTDEVTGGFGTGKKGVGSTGGFGDSLGGHTGGLLTSVTEG